MPSILPEENAMKPAIRVSSDDLLHPLDPMFRVCFDKVYNIRSTRLWKLRGHVREEALESLRKGFGECFQKNFDLVKAASHGKIRTVVRLLAEEADPNAVIGVQGNALLEAIRGRHYELAELLLMHNAEPYLGFAQFMTDSPLHMAITRGNRPLVRSIVKRSICSSCYQQPNQRALVERASVALAECKRPVEHLIYIQLCSGRQINFGGHRYTLKELREAMRPFCPQMWPMLVYVPVATIVAHRADFWLPPCDHRISTSLPTDKKLDISRY
jgi:hypothetical protein